MKFQIRDHLIGQVENELKPLLYLLGDVEVHGSVDRQANLTRNQTEETDFLFVVRIRIKSAQAQHTQAARSSDQRQGAGRHNAEFGKKESVFLKSRLSAPIECYQRLAGLVHPLNGGVLESKIVGGRNVYSFAIYFQ